MNFRSHIQQSLALLAPWLLFVSAAAGQYPLPAGNGKQAVEKICSGCHELDTVVEARHTMIGWQDMVQDMVSRGATGSDEELAAVIQYLTQFFGKINVNTATAKELGDFLGLSGQETQAIVDYREKNGNLKTLEQLKKVPGVNAEKVQSKKELIAFNQ